MQIKPEPGELTRVSGRMPHPEGDITVTVERKGTQGVSADVELPAGLQGEFIWNGKTVHLKGGKQRIVL